MRELTLDGSAAIDLRAFSMLHTLALEVEPTLGRVGVFQQFPDTLVELRLVFRAVSSTNL
jgi:hypothetical protein